MAATVRTRLALRLAFAAAWSILLALCGAVAITDWTIRFPGNALACVVAGVTLLAMAQFLFAALVADRVFPRASGGLSVAVQGAAAVVFVAGGAVLALQFLGAIL